MPGLTCLARFGTLPDESDDDSDVDEKLPVLGSERSADEGGGMAGSLCGTGVNLKGNLGKLPFGVEAEDEATDEADDDDDKEEPEEPEEPEEEDDDDVNNDDEDEREFRE